MKSNFKSSNFISIPRQAARLDERHKADVSEVICCGMRINVGRGVYGTSSDSELLAETVKISPQENFIEIGCGTGAVSIALAKRAYFGVGTDINDLAVKNSKLNAARYNVPNVEFFKSNVFENVKGKFNVIVCNPPYTKHEVTDDIDRMFWDPNDEMKRKFFEEAGKYLKDKGRIYFGWANFGDIDVELPFRLAEENGYKLINTAIKPDKRNEYTLFVLEFVKK